MNRFAEWTLLCLFFSVVSWCGRAHGSADIAFSGLLSFQYQAQHKTDGWQNRATIRYVPEVTVQHPFGELLWDIHLSIVGDADFESDSQTDSETSASIYRLNTRLATPKSDIRLGLQKINFGPARILRSLRWFDQIKPTDPLRATDGVTALRYRYFFENNANIWLWALYGNDDPKGYEQVATKEKSVEAGGRFQYPLQSGEIALSLHSRLTDRLGFSDEDVGKGVVENRLGLDGKWDLGPGVWCEYVLIDQGAGSLSDNNWLSLLTLGTDYTVDVGNGVYVMAEHLVTTLSENPEDWEQTDHISALQFSYPLSILDSVQLIQVYLWEHYFSYHYLNWTRTYDDWLLSVGIVIAPDESSQSDLLGFSGSGIQMMLVFNH